MKKSGLLPLLFGAPFSLSIVWGWQLENFDHLELGDVSYFFYWLVLTFVISSFVGLSWKMLYKNNRDKVLKEKVRTDMDYSYSDKKSFLLTLMILFICQLPVLLAEYPGFFCYDAQDEVTQVLTRSFSTHHPLVHVLLLGGFVALGHKLTGSYNLGIFSYMILQMLVIDTIFAYVLTYMRRRGISKKVRVFFTLFLGIFPTVVMYVLCSCKDGLFSAFLILTVLFLIQLNEDMETFLKSRKKTAGFVFSATAMMLFRHNGFYAFIVAAVFILILNRKYFKRLGFLFILPVILYMLLSGGMARVLHADSSENQEILTVPLQQIARTYNAHPDDFNDMDKMTLNRFLSDEALALYTPRVSDLLKSKFDNKAYEDYTADFWKLWLKMGLRYPLSYLNAWFMTSYGFWYPGAVINVYQGNTMFTFTYTDSSYFAYEVELPGVRHSLIPAIDSLYRKLSIEKFQQNIPVISLVFSPAFYFWVYMYFAFYMIYIQRAFLLKPLLLILMVWLTVLLGPTYLVRYVVYLWFGLPLLWIIGQVRLKKE
ncbi:MAG: DUF6020 family protein [Butyrivibrio sp.]|nr:DUF6020 family protein [Butyrivibrio sp.]